MRTSFPNEIMPPKNVMGNVINFDFFCSLLFFYYAPMASLHHLHLMITLFVEVKIKVTSSPLQNIDVTLPPSRATPRYTNQNTPIPLHYVICEWPLTTHPTTQKRSQTDCEKSGPNAHQMRQIWDFVKDLLSDNNLFLKVCQETIDI